MPRQATSLKAEFERALGETLARTSFFDRAANGTTKPSAIALAYSGGLDSSAMLRLAQSYAVERNIPIVALHVHHGLSPQADDWALHCEDECRALGVPFEMQRVALRPVGGESLEQLARAARYKALGSMCRVRGIKLLLTAHHQDDQAETVLLHLLRGSGTAGLSGMDNENKAPDLLGDPDLCIGRPLLAVPRKLLEEFVAGCGIGYVDDESNADTRFARNALRHHVMREMSDYFPGYAARLARTARHAQAAQRLLDELGTQDILACTTDGALDLHKVRTLNDDRIDNLFRTWFFSKRVRMPSSSWLAEMRVQVFSAREDAQVRVVHPDCEVRRHRHKVFILPRDKGERPEPRTFRWQGEQTIDFPEFGGMLQFIPHGRGIDSEWLRNQTLEMGYRLGGEQIKPAWNRSTRSLKHLYQAMDIAPWLRTRLPLVRTGTEVVFAAGIGMNWRILKPSSEAGISLHWKQHE